MVTTKRIVTIAAAATGLIWSASAAQVPSAGGGQPTGVCQVWNGHEFVTERCSSPGGGRDSFDPVGVDWTPPPNPRELADDLDREGASLLTQGRLGDALDRFDRALRLVPDDSAALYGVCREQATDRYFVEAYGLCVKATSLDRGAIARIWNLGKQELASYTASLRGDARRQASTRALAPCRATFEQLAHWQAVACLDGYLAAHADAAEVRDAQRMKGLSLTRLGRFAEAEQALYRAYTSDPQRALEDIRQDNHPNLADALWDLNASRALAITAKVDVAKAEAVAASTEAQRLSTEQTRTEQLGAAGAVSEEAIAAARAAARQAAVIADAAAARVQQVVDQKLLKVSLLQISLRFSPNNYRSQFWLAVAEADVSRFRDAHAHFRAAIDSHMGAASMNQQLGTHVQEFHGYPDASRLETVANEIVGELGKLQRDASDELALATELEGLGMTNQAERKAYDQIALQDLRAAHTTFDGLLAKFPGNAEFRHQKEILSRINHHEPLYITEARRQAEAARKNGHDGVLYEVDQNIRCVAGQTFDGAGSCINNGFSWP